MTPLPLKNNPPYSSPFLFVSSSFSLTHLIPTTLACLFHLHTAHSQCHFTYLFFAFVSLHCLSSCKKSWDKEKEENDELDRRKSIFPFVWSLMSRRIEKMERVLCEGED
jgi:hypothetical protein